MSNHDRDVAIIGGGPAGSVTARHLCKGGLSCVVLEREKFPRPHVGESLVPSTTRVFREIGSLEQMETNRFPRKYGAAWTTSRGIQKYDHDWAGIGSDCQVDVRFEEREQKGVDQPYTYHVDRGRFDQLPRKHAATLGARVAESTSVSKVNFEDDGVRINYRRNGEEPGALRARMVVDASGRKTLLGKRLGLRIEDCVFDQ